MNRLETIDSAESSKALIKHIEETFKTYDESCTGFLEKVELRHFQDDLRLSLSLTKCDNKIFNRIFKILDDDRSGTIELNEQVGKLDLVIPILCEPGEEMEKFIRIIFRDFDLDGSGYLEKKEMRLQCDIQSDKMGVERCKEWQIDYIVSLLDFDSNQKIDIDELKYQYSIINLEISKNPKKTGKKKQTENIFPTCLKMAQKMSLAYQDIINKEAIRYLKNDLRVLKGKAIEESDVTENELLNSDGDSEVEGDNQIKKPKRALGKNNALFTEELKRIFLIYDEDENGELDESEIKDFQDDVRVSLSLTKTTPAIRQEVLGILDEDQGGTVDFQEFKQNLHKIMPVLCRIGDDMVALITKIFDDFDVDKNGILDKKEFKLILDLHCDKMGVLRCTDDQLAKIFEDLEFDESPKINLEDLLRCYPLINQHISHNKQKVFNHRQSVMQSELNVLDRHKVSDTGFNILTKHAISYIRRLKVGDQQEARKILENPESRLDEINNNQSHVANQVIPLTNQVNSPFCREKVDRPDKSYLNQITQNSHYKKKIVNTNSLCFEQSSESIDVNSNSNLDIGVKNDPNVNKNYSGIQNSTKSNYNKFITQNSSNIKNEEFVGTDGKKVAFGAKSFNKNNKLNIPSNLQSNNLSKNEAAIYKVKKGVKSLYNISIGLEPNDCGNILEKLKKKNLNDEIFDIHKKSHIKIERNALQDTSIEEGDKSKLEEEDYTVILATINKYVKVSKHDVKEQHNFFTQFNLDELSYLFKSIKELKDYYEKNLEKLSSIIKGGYQYLEMKTNHNPLLPKFKKDQIITKTSADDNGSVCSVDQDTKFSTLEELKQFVKNLTQPTPNLENLKKLNLSVNQIKSPKLQSKPLLKLQPSNLNPGKTLTLGATIPNRSGLSQSPMKIKDIYYTPRGCDSSSKLPNKVNAKFTNLQISHITNNLAPFYENHYQNMEESKVLNSNIGNSCNTPDIKHNSTP